MPYVIGELTLLQRLPLFIVGNDNEGSRDHKIGGLMELQRLNELRGCIKGEILKEKQYLRSLILEWHQWGENENDELVMEGLQPHPNLKEFFINCYGECEGGFISNAILPISSIPHAQLDAEVEGIVEDGVTRRARSFISLSFKLIYTLVA
ncbi:hypothetical protein AAG906_025644 [Vitis piasezkii]